VELEASGLDEAGGGEHGAAVQWAGCGRRRRARAAVRRYRCGGGATGPADERILAAGADGCEEES
jgi:hypothetical protein